MPERRPLVFLTGEYPPARGGLADYTLRLRQGLAAQGVPSEVVTRRADRGPFASPDVHRDVGHWSLPSLLRILRQLAPDAILHLQYQPAAFDLRGEVCLLPLLAHRYRPDVRLVTTFHDTRVPYLFPKAVPLRPRAVRLLARTSHAVIAAETADLDTLGAPPWHSYLVPIGSNVAFSPPPGYDRQRFRAALGLTQSDLAVAYFGFLNASKGLDTLLAAFREIQAASPSARLLLLGGATSASDATDAATAAAFASATGTLGSTLVQPGYLAPSNLSAYLLAADVALLPFADGASLRRGSLLACLAHQLPVVTTLPRSESSPALARAILTTPADDPAALARLVMSVGHDSSLRARLQSAMTKVNTLTSWERIAALHRGVYAALAH